MSDDIPNHPRESTEALEALVRRHVTALNGGDPAAIAADWAPSGTLIDAFPPFVWQGEDVTGHWLADLKAATGPAGIDRIAFSIDGWQRLYVVGDHGYAVADAHVLISGPAIALKAIGTWTFAANRSDHGWKIASWIWGGPPTKPI